VANIIPADDDIYYGQAACESLIRVAVANQSLYSVDTAGKKRSKVGSVEVEYFDGTSKEVWGEFADNLQNLCPLIWGYTGLASKNTLCISPSDRFVISPCLCIDPCDCSDEQKGIYEDEWCNGASSTNDDPFQ
jgi:hypothetical protein